MAIPTQALLPISNAPSTATAGPQPSAPGAQTQTTSQALGSATPTWNPGQDNATSLSGTYSGKGFVPTNAQSMAGGIGQVNNAPINQAQQAQAYVDPMAAANYASIAGMQGTMLQGYGPGGSSLAGITQLGGVTNANQANIATNQSNALLGGQVSNINALNAEAQGQGPNPAAIAAQQQTQANIAANMAEIGSQRGSSNSALGLRQAQEQNATAQQQGVQSAVQGQAAQELAAQQQLTGALSGTQGQVQQGAQAQAALTQQTALANQGAANASTLQQGTMSQQTALANLSAQLQAGQINMNEYNAMVQAQMTQSANDFSAQQNYAGLVTGENTTLQGVQRGVDENVNNNNLGMVSAGVAGAAGVGAGALTAMSDRRVKTEIRPATRDIKSFLSQIAASMPRSGFALLGGS